MDPFLEDLTIYPALLLYDMLTGQMFNIFKTARVLFIINMVSFSPVPLAGTIGARFYQEATGRRDQTH